MQLPERRHMGVMKFIYMGLMKVIRSNWFLTEAIHPVPLIPSKENTLYTIK
jgi:hypothetical protein